MCVDASEWQSERIGSGKAPGARQVALAELPGRSFYIHMNNTNPILDTRSEARARVLRAGVEIAEDGAEIEL